MENEIENEIENDNENENQIENENDKIFNQKLFQDYQKLMQNKNESDFIIKTGKDSFEFYSHKLILISRSPYFSLLLKEKNINQIEFPQFKKENMEQILKYIYSSQIEIKKENLIDLLIISNKFQLNLLYNYIENQIIKIINEENKIENKNKKIEKQKQKQEINQKNQEIEQKNKENEKQKQEIQKQKQEVQEQKQEIDQKNKEIEEQKQEINQMKPIYEEMKPIYEEIKKLQKTFSDSEIIKEIEMMKRLKEWINDDEFFYKMKKGFSTKKDGFTGNKWHSICDNKGKTLIIIKTTDNYIFGGFTQVGFISGSDGDYIKDSNAFIFSLKNPKNDLPQKFEIQENREDYAILYDSSEGPRFGDNRGQYNTDIRIFSDLQSGQTDFGATYKLPNGLKHNTSEAKSYLAGSYSSWTVDELETYFI
ncbi:pep-cterm sorting domain-containing protein [Anaeramoeba ignava]|uniref:Pep-cterm sorting domain-containing protein n=1 Tax=Anaeramoeba ignava TaxID=1746090 RepID=A0A9Q0LQ35_ANAIG|nr:pep-cterm sorting domain-containing protein [Anaeramoeba ignava]